MSHCHVPCMSPPFFVNNQQEATEGKVSFRPWFEWIPSIVVGWPGGQSFWKSHSGGRQRFFITGWIKQKSDRKALK